MANVTPFILILASLGLFFGYINPTYTAPTGSLDPATKSVKELKIEAQEYDDAINKAKEIERIRDSLNNTFKSISRDDIEKISRLLPDHIDSVRLIIDINSVAKRFGMTLRNINLAITNSTANNRAIQPAGVSSPSASPGASAVFGGGVSTAPGNQKYDSAQLSFSVSGSYENFIGFLKELEQSLRIVDVTTLSFKAVGASDAHSAVNKGNNPLGAPAISSPISSGDNYEYTMSIRTYYLK